MDTPIPSFIRAALFVTDLDRATAFYRTLGPTGTCYDGGRTSRRG
jgi:hypothetical protein